MDVDFESVVMYISCVIPMEVKQLVRVHGGGRKEIEYRCRIKGKKCSNRTVKIKWGIRVEEGIGAGITKIKLFEKAIGKHTTIDTS